MFIFAHRGASHDAPENTLAAIRLALQQNTDGIEIDVFQVDNEFIVIHDCWVQRTTNGNGHLSTLSFPQIRSLDAGNGEIIPTLREVMEVVGKQCVLNIEIKGVSDVKKLIDYTLSAAKSLNIQLANLLFSSFDHHILKQISALNQELKIGALTASIPIDYALFAQQLNAYSVHVDGSCINQEFVNDAHKRGLKIYVYTVDEPADILRFKQWKVDGIFTNKPKASQQIVNNC